MNRPIRTCVGCRERQPQMSLLRVRRLEHGALVPAARRGRGGAAQGRSAYLCPDAACLELAIRRGGLRRAFAREGRVQTHGPELWSALQDSILRRRELLDRSARDPEHLPGYRQLRDLGEAMLASRREA